MISNPPTISTRSARSVVITRALGPTGEAAFRVFALTDGYNASIGSTDYADHREALIAANKLSQTLNLPIADMALSGR